MKELILFRGLPGSGKTTLAESLLDIVFSADDYFICADGYKFNPDKIRDAHAWCQQNASDAMHDGVDRIGVANTFTQEWEMKPYIEAAERYGYRVHTIIVENRHGSNDIHEVPQVTKDKMRKRFSVSL